MWQQQTITCSWATARKPAVACSSAARNAAAPALKGSATAAKAARLARRPLRKDPHTLLAGARAVAVDGARQAQVICGWRAPAVCHPRVDAWAGDGDGQGAVWRQPGGAAGVPVRAAAQLARRCVCDCMRQAAPRRRVLAARPLSDAEMHALMGHPLLRLCQGGLEGAQRAQPP